MSITIDSTLATEQAQFSATPSNNYSLILVVEDSKDIRDLLADLLEGEGYRTVFATKGEDGLSAAKTFAPHLILMDLSLPGMDGWEAVRQLRKEKSSLHTPIIALSAHASEQIQQRALEAGCTAYVSKPFDTDLLLEVIARYVPHLEPDL